MVRRTKARVTGALEALVAICWKWAARKRCCGTSGSFGTRVTGQGESNPARHAPAGRGPGFCLQTPLQIRFSESPFRGGGTGVRSPSSTRSPQTLWTLCRYGRMPEVTSFGVADLGTIVAASITQRREKMAPHRDSSPPSLTTAEGCPYRFQETRLSLLFHARHKKFTCKSQVPWLPVPFQARATAPSPAMLRAPLCFQNRSPPLDAIRPCATTGIIHQTTKPPVAFTARPHSRPHSPSSHPQT